jgi:hypothetical protein
VSCGGDTAAEGASIDSGISAICSSRNGVARGASCVQFISHTSNIIS